MLNWLKKKSERISSPFIEDLNNNEELFYYV